MNCKRWIVKHGFVKDVLVKQGFVKHGFLKGKTFLCK